MKTEERRFRRGRAQQDPWGKSEDDKRVNEIKVSYVHVWKCHNETHYFVQLIYANKVSEKNLTTVGNIRIYFLFKFTLYSCVV
jgi:hypothetical protein